MPDATIIQNVVFDVGARETDELRASWQAAETNYKFELAAKHIDLFTKLSPALEKWAASYNALNKSVQSVNQPKALWTSIAPLVRAKIKTEARNLQFDSAAVAELTAQYLTEIHELGGAAEKDLARILLAIGKRAEEHQRRAAVTARGR